MKDILKGIIYTGLFAVPFIPLIVTDSLFFPFITGKNFTFRIIVEIVFASWVLLALLDRTYRPRFSWLLAGLSSFIVVMFFANLFGEYAPKSFWSNYERMDGYITLVHFYLFFVVLAHTFQSSKVWLYYLGLTVAIAAGMALDGWSQFLSEAGARRVDSQLGNAAYMAIYMMFHAFFAVWLFVQTRNVWLRIALALTFLLCVYILLLTGTRGTFLALVGGMGLVGLYIALFSRSYPTLRKISFGVLASIVIFIGGIYIFKDTAFISENVGISRIANIDLSEDLKVRTYIWGMAIEGVKDRPILGWGQGNFNYIFNERYDPNLYNAEAWYDRAHNLFLDWLVAGGILGLLSYLSIFAALVYYLLWRPFFKHDPAEDDKYFSVPERAVLIGLIAGYFVHNLVVFDNIVSFIFFAIVLALIHARVGEIIPAVDDFEIDPRIVNNIFAPVLAVVLAVTVYYVNIPALQASADIIDSLRTETIAGRLAEFDSALARGSFSYQEIVEQLAQQAMNIGINPNITPEQKRAFIVRAEEELLNLAEAKPNDARIHVFIAGFYRSLGSLNRAAEQIKIARDLSPTKQTIILEQGIIEYQRQNYEAMNEYFGEAFRLQEENVEARIFYANSFLYLDQPEKIDELIGEQYFRQYALSDFSLQAAEANGYMDLVERILRERIEYQPNNAQHRTSLSFVLFQEERPEEAIAVLEEAVNEIPSFAEKGQCYIANIEAGVRPDEGC